MPLPGAEHCAPTINRILQPGKGGAPPTMELFSKDVAGKLDEWLVCAEHDTQAFPRLVAQQGLFTVSSKPMIDHWQLATSLAGDCYEINLPARLKRAVLRRLRVMGVTAASMYPDVGGVAQDICRTQGFVATPPWLLGMGGLARSGKRQCPSLLGC